MDETVQGKAKLHNPQGPKKIMEKKPDSLNYPRDKGNERVESESATLTQHKKQDDTI